MKCVSEATTSKLMCYILQGFRWVIDNDKWKDQCTVMKQLFEGMIMFLKF